jgi:predicted RNA-binding protein with PUA-like domain
MAFWLLKTEPHDYSFDDLLNEKKTVWDGVTNNWALKNMKEVRTGDQVFIYHTGKEKRIAGIAEVCSDPYPDPKAADPKYIVFDVIPKQKLNGHVTLKMLKSDSFFSEFMLVKFTRLSVLPVPEKIWTRIRQLDTQFSHYD